MSDVAIERFLADQDSTARLGQDLAQAVRRGDVIALHGDVGAGKTSLARALIRAIASEEDLEVPSPTFTLVQTYEGRLTTHHFDLYRLGSPDELTELDFAEAVSDGLTVIEWPDRAGDRIPDNAIHIYLTHQQDGRMASISGGRDALARVERSLQGRDLLEKSGWGSARRKPFPADASARSYEFVTLPGAEDRILMNSPPLVLGPPVKNGRAYAEIAHTSRTVAAFVGVDNALRTLGLCVPEIYGQDIENGFLLIENLGAHGLLDPAGTPIPERYEAAAQLLAFAHAQPCPTQFPVTPTVEYVVPPFDRGAMMIEVELLVEWFVPRQTGKPATPELRHAFARQWNALIDRLETSEIGLVQRDYHSPNLVWREQEIGHDRLGVLDFQDALIGPVAYDVASLALDARVSISRELEQRVVSAYMAARGQEAGFDPERFRETYAIMAAQRNSKILGIFVRLDQRDGKPQYLKHLPRIRDYLSRALAHPSLAGLSALYRQHGFLEEVQA